MLAGFCAANLLYTPVYFRFSRIPFCISLLESVLRAIVNRSRPGLNSDYVAAASFTLERIQGLRMTSIYNLL